MSARVLVAGREGQVARALRDADAPGYDIVAMGRPDLDLIDPASIERTMAEVAPAIVINAAAYTAVDRAESEPDAARAVNALGAGALAEAAARAGVPIIHVSTDYVFDGTAGRPYRTDDPVSPLGAYGRSKEEGERLVRAATPDHAIVRTSWVHAPHGGNFVRTMLQLASERDEVRVVADQRGRPSYAPDIAHGLLAVVGVLMEGEGGRGEGARGTHHLAGTGEASWADLAEAVFEASAARNGPSARVVRIGTVDYPTPAARPPDSRLDTTGFAPTFGYAMSDWRDGVERCVGALLSSPH